MGEPPYWFVRKQFVLSALVLLMFCLPGNAAVMKAGVAKVDITPPAGVQMWGYFNRLKGAEGAIDPLYARVLVLEAGDQRLAYVDLDLGRTFGPASLERLKQAARTNERHQLPDRPGHSHSCRTCSDGCLPVGNACMGDGGAGKD